MHSQNRWRFLITAGDCGRQVIHADGHALDSEEVMSSAKFPGMFMLCTFEDETPLWVCRYSHHTVAQAWLIAEAEAVGKLSEVVIMGKVMIPAWNIMVARMDVQHAGAGTKDYDTRKDT